MNFLRRLWYVFHPDSAYSASYAAVRFFGTMTANGRNARLVFDAKRGHLVCKTSRDWATGDRGTYLPPALQEDSEVQVTIHLADAHTGANA